MNVDEPIESQHIKDWRKEQELELINHCRIIEGHKYVSFDKAKNFMARYFTKGFKTARRDRSSLADDLIQKMKNEFVITKRHC